LLGHFTVSRSLDVTVLGKVPSSSEWVLQNEYLTFTVIPFMRFYAHVERISSLHMLSGCVFVYTHTWEHCPRILRYFQFDTFCSQQPRKFIHKIFHIVAFITKYLPNFFVLILMLVHTVKSQSLKYVLNY